MTLKSITPSLQLTTAWLTMFLVGTEFFIMSPLLPFVASDFHVSAAAAGTSVAIFGLTYMLVAPLLGNIADRIGRQRVLIGCLFGFAAANFLTASAASLPSLLAARLVAGAAAAGVAPSVYALVDSVAPANRRATWLGLVVTGLLMSLALGAPAGALVGAWCGWAPIFIALAVLILLLVWLNWRVWPGEPHGKEARTHGHFCSAALLARLAPTVVWSMGLYGVYTYLGAGLVTNGFTTSQSAQAILSYGCGAVAGALIGGNLADRTGVRFAIGLSFGGLCGCFLLLRLAFYEHTLVAPALGISSAVAQLFFPAQQAGLAKDFPSQRAAALAWNNSALYLGISLGSLLGATMMAIGNFGDNLIMSAIITSLGWILNRAIPPKLDDPLR